MIDLTKRLPPVIDGDRHPNIVVVGYARSGTTLLHLLLSFCFKDTEMVFPEHLQFPNILIKTNKKWVITKSKEDINNIESILDFSVDTHIILIVRDLRDILVSRNYSHKWNFISDAKEIVDRFKLNNILNIDKELKNRFIVIKYENLVRFPNETQKFLSKSIRGLEPSCSFSDFFKNKELLELSKNNKNFNEYIKNLKSSEDCPSLRPIDKDSIGRWKKDEFARRIITNLMSSEEVFIEFQELLEYFQYENNVTWFDEFMRKHNG